MKEEYDIVTTVELEGGLAKMCNLSEYIEEKGIEKELQQGIEHGIYITLVSLVKQGIITMEKAAKEAGVPVEEFVTAYQNLAETINNK